MKFKFLMCPRFVLPCERAVTRAFPMSSVRYVDVGPDSISVMDVKGERHFMPLSHAEALRVVRMLEARSLVVTESVETKK